MTDWLEEINWNEDGLVPAIAQDHKTGRILMMAWMNRDSLRLSVDEGRAIYWSRSRGKLWRKGEESGHVQKLHELRLDCDADVIVLQVEQLPHLANMTRDLLERLSRPHLSDPPEPWRRGDSWAMRLIGAALLMGGSLFAVANSQALDSLEAWPIWLMTTTGLYLIIRR